MTGAKNNMPKDLQAMSSILKDFGITDRENGVENHMLDFTNSKLGFYLNYCYYPLFDVFITVLVIYFLRHHLQKYFLSFQRKVPT